MTRISGIRDTGRFGILMFLITAQLGCMPARAADVFALRQILELQLPGEPTRFDYQSYDEDKHLLFIAHLGDGRVTVVDTDIPRVVADIAGISQVHGVLAIPALGRIYASATGHNQVVAIDEDTLRVVATIEAGNYPDGMTYAPNQNKLYVSDETGGTETVIDVAGNRRLATISLGGEAGNSQYDPVSGHVFVNVQTRNDLVEINPETDRIVARHPLSGAERNHGLLIVPDRRLAFVACEGNARLLIVDLRTMRVVAADSVGESPDVLAFDPAFSLLYVASESGVLSVFHVRGNTVFKAWQARVDVTAHSVAVDTRTHRVYLPLEDIHGKPVLRVMQPMLPIRFHGTDRSSANQTSDATRNHR